MTSLYWFSPQVLAFCWSSDLCFPSAGSKTKDKAKKASRSLTVRVIIIICQVIHYSDVTMDAMASQITSLTIVYPTVYSDADQRKHQSSASLAFVWGIHRWPVNSPHKGPVTRKMFPFDDVIMIHLYWSGYAIIAELPIHGIHDESMICEIIFVIACRDVVCGVVMWCVNHNCAYLIYQYRIEIWIRLFNTTRECIW